MDNVCPPENGFNERIEILRDDGYNLPQDLDLFRLDNQEPSDYINYNLENDFSFDLSLTEQEQSQMLAPELPDSFGYEGLINPNDNFNLSSLTGGNNDVLHGTDANVIYNPGMLELTPFELRQNEEYSDEYTGNLYAGYLRESDSQVDLSRMNDVAHRNVDFVFPYGGEGVEMPNFPRTDAMDEELNQCDGPNNVESDVPIYQIENLHISTGDAESDGGIIGFGNGRDLNKELNNSLSSDPQGMSFGPVEAPQYQIISATDGLQEYRRSSSVNPVLDHSFHAYPDDSESPLASLQRPQHPLDDPATHLAAPEMDRPIRDSRNQQKRSPEIGDGFYQSRGGSTRHVYKEINSSSHKHKQEWSGRAGHRVSTSSRRSPAPTRTRTSRRDRHRGEVRSRVRGRNHHAGRKREREYSRSRSPPPRDHHRRRHESRRKSPAWRGSSRQRSRGSRHLRPSPTRTGIGRPGACLFVAGFAYTTSERDLERRFSQYGRVRTVRIIRNQSTGISRGYGFVTLRKDEEADAAIRDFDKNYWNGRLMLVEKSFRR